MKQEDKPVNELHRKILADIWDIQFGIANVEGEKSPTYALMNDIRNRINLHFKESVQELSKR